MSSNPYIYQHDCLQLYKEKLVDEEISSFSLTFVEAPSEVFRTSCTKTDEEVNPASATTGK